MSPEQQRVLEAVLLAYGDNALGEKDRQKVEALLAGRPDLRTQVEQWRQEQALLHNGLARHPAPTQLDPTRREAIRAMVAVPRRPWWHWSIPVAAAAAVALMVMGVSQLVSARPGCSPSQPTTAMVRIDPLAELAERSDRNGTDFDSRQYGDYKKNGGDKAIQNQDGREKDYSFRWLSTKDVDADGVRSEGEVSKVTELNALSINLLGSQPSKGDEAGASERCLAKTETDIKSEAPVEFFRGRTETRSVSQGDSACQTLKKPPATSDVKTDLPEGKPGRDCLQPESGLLSESDKRPIVVAAGLVAPGKDLSSIRGIAPASPQNLPDDHGALAWNAEETRTRKGRREAGVPQPQARAGSEGASTCLESVEDTFKGHIRDGSRGPRTTSDDQYYRRYQKSNPPDLSNVPVVGDLFDQSVGGLLKQLPPPPPPDSTGGQPAAEPLPVVRHSAIPPATPVANRMLERVTSEVKPPTVIQPSEEAARSPATKSPLPPVNPWVMTCQDHLATFALDVDTASFRMAASYLAKGKLPPPRTVRMEEFVNAFDYAYPAVAEGTFNVQAEAGPAPFAAKLTLLKVGVQARVLGRANARPAHLVAVIDASGSMDRDDRLPRVKTTLAAVLEQMAPTDRLSVVAFRGDAGTQTICENRLLSDRSQILQEVSCIQAGGTSNLLAGLESGYELAARHFRAGGDNRVLVCSDGMANVGLRSVEQVLDKVGHWRTQGIATTTVGFGLAAWGDDLLEQLANCGDGQFLFVAGDEEVSTVARELSASFKVVAYDARIQVDFAPQRVRRYRQIGYENRAIADRDFRNDRIDAGEVASGQSATCLFELELDDTTPDQDLGTVYIRYRDAVSRQVVETAHRLTSRMVRPRTAQEDPRFLVAACAAEFAELLRRSPHAADGSFQSVLAVLIPAARALPLDARIGDLVRMVQAACGLPPAED